MKSHLNIIKSWDFFYNVGSLRDLWGSWWSDPLLKLTLMAVPAKCVWMGLVNMIGSLHSSLCPECKNVLWLDKCACNVRALWVVRKCYINTLHSSSMFSEAHSGVSLPVFFLGSINRLKECVYCFQSPLSSCSNAGEVRIDFACLLCAARNGNAVCRKSNAVWCDGWVAPLWSIMRWLSFWNLEPSAWAVK